MSVQFRELPGAEWSRLVAEGIPPYDVAGLPPDNGHWRIFVAERDEKIVGCTSLHTQIHWDPWYIAPGESNLGGVRGLIRQGRDVLQELGIDHVFCTIEHSSVLSRDQAERLGFKAAPGQLYLLDVANLEEV